MSDKEIEIIEGTLLDLAIEGDTEAAGQFSDLHLSRRSWERAQSAQSWQDLLYQARVAQVWLTANQ
jgi:hypothetical protein